MRQFLMVVALLATSLVHADELRVVNSPATFPIATPGGTTTFVYDAANDHEVVGIAANAVAGDIEIITGQRPNVVTSLGDAGNTPVIAGTIGRSALIDGLISAGKLDVSAISGKWEAYSLRVISNPQDGIQTALVIAGSTPRGTAYGLFELSRLMGVSPWVWWADVAPEPRTALYATEGTLTVGEPSVKFRGIFINDEDWGIQPWAAKNMDTDIKDMGPNTYARICELLLRLRANILWPAMHDCTKAFWYYVGNPEVAKKYDIVLGSSHCEPMLRNNVFEWFNEGGNWGNWNYKTNASGVQQYWATRVEQSKNQDVIYTLGMRGVHDGPINGYSGAENIAAGLSEIIAYQRSLINEKIGDPTTVPQMFCPYKEVLDAYNTGKVNLPEDITLCWVDDNHGYIRQMPTTTEQQRSGSNGIYYHLSYWGSPMDYLWLSTISPSLISYELSRAYDQGVQRLWVINVGDIKPAEEELEFCMDLAWDVEAWQPERAAEYSRAWAARTFGEDVADEIGAIKREYYRLAAGGKPEHISLVTYSQAEIANRMADYKAIADRVEAVKSQIPARLQDAFFEMVEYPVRGAYLMNVKHLRAQQSFLYARAGKRTEALAAAAEAHAAYDEIQTLTTRYNTETAGGKWNGMMSSRPRGLSTFNMPSVATASDVASVESELDAENNITIPAANYTSASASVKTIDGLGLQQQAVCVWPMILTSYDKNDVASAPYAEYSVAVEKGVNIIRVRCLPTFPLNSNYDLRYAVSIDGAAPTIQSIKTTAMTSAWEPNVLRGWAGGAHCYVSDNNKEVRVRVYFLDPALVLSELVCERPADNFTDEHLVNPDFEYSAENTINSGGATVRGVPYGWQTNTVPTGNSYGINNDCQNRHGDNVCWFRGTPMPEEFKLYQRVEGLPAGTYRVECRLWAEKDLLGSVRLFANDNVQYFGKASDYVANRTEGETATFAGYEGTTTQSLKDMYVDVTISEGETLELGIKTSNQKSDGTRATDATGWFKCDYFRIRPYTPAVNLGSITYREPDTDMNASVSNAEFSSNTDGWTRTFSGGTYKVSTAQKGDGSVIKSGEGHLQVWNGSSVNGRVYQSLSGLPNGYYRLRAAMYNEFSGSVSLYANADKTSTVNRQNAYYDVLTEVVDGTMELGLLIATTGTTDIEMDHVTLTYLAPRFQDMQAIAVQTDGSLYPYASTSRYEAMSTAVAAAPSSLADKVEASVTLLAAIRSFVESNAKAEGIGTASEQTSLLSNPDGQAADGWTLSGGFAVSSNEDMAYHTADGTAIATRFHKAWSSNTAGSLSQTVTALPAGRYLLTVGVRGDVSSIDLNGADVTYLRRNLFGCEAGWDDAAFVFTQAETADRTLTLNISGSWATLTHFRLTRLSQDLTAAPASDMDNAIIRLPRTLAAGWNALVLPFDMNAEQLHAAFGQAAEVRTLNTALTLIGNTASITFEEATSTEAGVPFVLKLPAAGSGYYVENVNVRADAPSTAVASSGTTSVTLQGTYDGASITSDFHFLSGTTLYHHADGKAAVTAQPFSAWFTLETASEVKLAANFDGIETGVEEISLTPIPSPKGEGSIYTLDGRRVSVSSAYSALPKGVYLIGNRKVAVK